MDQLDTSSETLSYTQSSTMAVKQAGADIFSNAKDFRDLSSPVSIETGAGIQESVAIGTVNASTSRLTSLSTNTVNHNSTSASSPVVTPLSTFSLPKSKKAKAFIPRSQPEGAVPDIQGPSFPSSMRYPSSTTINVAYGVLSNRAVSLPTDAAAEKYGAAASGHVHTNRIVSLPESDSFLTLLDPVSGASTVEERASLEPNGPLIDLSSPPRSTMSTPYAYGYPSSLPSTPGLSEGDGEESVEVRRHCTTDNTS